MFSHGYTFLKNICINIKLYIYIYVYIYIYNFVSRGFVFEILYFVAVYPEVVNRKCLRYAEVQKNVYVSYTMLNNLHIHMNDPCKLKWKLPIEHLKLLNAETLKTDNKLQKL